MKQDEIIKLNKEGCFVEGLSLKDFSMQALRMRKQSILEVMQKDVESEVQNENNPTTK